MKETPWKPTKQQLKDAVGKQVPDVIAENLKVLFCGINPGLYTAAVQHHFARPGNRFWVTLHASGFTPEVLSPFDEQKLLALGLGITNVVNKATAAASDLSPDDFREGGRILMSKVLKYRPRVLAVLGVGAYREAFNDKKAQVGLLAATIGFSKIWVLPNPSGLNANYQVDSLTKLFRELYDFVD